MGKINSYIVSVIFALLFITTNMTLRAELVVGRTYKGNDGTQYIITGVHPSYANTYYGDIAYLSNTATSLNILDEATIVQTENNRTISYTIKVRGFSNSAIGHYQDEKLQSITFNCKFPLIPQLLWNRPNLQYVNLVNQKNIPDQFCLSSTKLSNIKLNGLVETIGNFAFSECKSLRLIPQFPQLKRIGEGAFYNCPLEGTLEFPESLNSIGASAFTCGGSSFKPASFDKIICNSITPPQITGEGFAFLVTTHENTILYVPKESVDLYKNAYEWKEFYKIKAIGEIEATSITLDKTEISLKVGEAENLYVKIMPENTTDKSIKWESEDETIATVSPSGVVNALSVGSTIVTATCGEVSASCKIVVSPVPASEITISSPNLTLTVGQTERLTATIIPENATSKALEWRSSDETIAAVDEYGLVSAHNAGNCQIIVKTRNESNLSATCDVIVIKPEVLVSSISLSPSSVEGKEGEQIQITATIHPEDATNKTIVWSSSDESVATVDDTGLISLLKMGTAVITASATDDSGVSAECAVAVSELGGIDEIIADKSVYVKIFNLKGVLVYEGIYSEASLLPDYYIIACDGKNIKVKVK